MTDEYRTNIIVSEVRYVKKKRQNEYRFFWCVVINYIKVLAVTRESL